MKKLLLIPITVVTAFMAFTFLQPGTAGGVIRAVAPTLLAALPSTISQATGSVLGAPASNGGLGSSGQGSAQGSAQSSRSGALSNPSDALVNPETRTTTVHSVATAGQVNCGRFGGGFHGGKHLTACPYPPYAPPANH